MTSPILSIILPAYNAQAYIAETIQSVLAQDFTDFELLIIDDGSQDNTAEVIRNFSDSRIIYIKNEQNLGLIRTLNKGILLAKGTYIGRIDADDIWHDARKIRLQLDYFTSNPGTVLLGTNAIAIDEYGNTLFDMNYPSGETAIRGAFLSRNPFIHPSVIFLKNAAVEAGGFILDELHAEDYGLWLRIAKLGHVNNLSEALMKYRIHSTGISQKNALTQTRQSLKITKSFKYIYGGYWKGRIKWNLKICVLYLKGLSFLNLFKRTIQKSVQ